MLLVNQLVGFGAGGALRGLVPVHWELDTTNAATRTYTGTPIGTPAPDRRIVVTQWSGHAVGTSTSTCTVAGGATTRVVASASSDVNGNFLAIYVTDSYVATGETATIEIDNSTTASHTVFGVYAVYGLTGTTAHDTGAITATDPSFSINTVAGGILVAITGNSVDGATVTWTNATEHFDVDVEALRHSSGAYDNTLSTAAITLTAAYTSSSSDKMVAATWSL